MPLQALFHEVLGNNSFSMEKGPTEGVYLKKQNSVFSCVFAVAVSIGYV